MTRITFSESEIRRYYEARFPKVRQCGKELRAACPIHKGTREPLAINLETGVWFCHSGCSRGGSIFDFEAEFSGSNEKSPYGTVLNIVGRSAEPERRIVATYDYTDENSVLLYPTVRLQPKDFKQRRPNGRGGWIWDLKGVRCPYIAAVSATKRSGKTRFAETIEPLARRPWRGTAHSPAALYRMLEGAPTLLLDETFRDQVLAALDQVLEGSWPK